MVKIIIIDDHALFRIGLVAILKKESCFDVIGEFQSFSQLRSSISELDAHLILVDISLHKESGIEVAKTIKCIRPLMKIVILSSHKEEFYLINAIEANVDGYIHKNADPEELILGINKVMRGEKFYSLEISNLLVGCLSRKTHHGLPFLTHKEKEIVKYLMEGFSSKEIADKLNVSPRTVESHRANVLGKYGLRNTTELIAKVMGQKIGF